MISDIACQTCLCARALADALKLYCCLNKRGEAGPCQRRYMSCCCGVGRQRGGEAVSEGQTREALRRMRVRFYGGSRLCIYVATLLSARHRQPTAPQAMHAPCACLSVPPSAHTCMRAVWPSALDISIQENNGNLMSMIACHCRHVRSACQRCCVLSV